ncbi:MAG: energy-coupling factor transporter ATPase, partial [Clostridia bacterium]|nr:energy-coupling factor transporter ATPase [Clostridia bacterium]
MAKIELVGVSYLYGKGTPFEKLALDKVNAVFEDNRINGLIGHTGCGKSTLVQLLNGLLTPTEGKVLLDGRDINEKGFDRRALRFRVGLVFQYPEYQLFEETVLADVSFGPKNMGLGQDEINDRVRRSLRFVGLGDDILQASPFDLSGGQKRRAAIAGIMAMEPQVLVLDEPMAGLDPSGRNAIMGYIKNYREKHRTTVIFVTHSMEDAAKHAQRLIVMHQGSILMQGSPDEVFRRSDEIRAAGLNTPMITDLFAELANRGLNVPRSVYTVEQGLEVLRSLKV